ncbi:MAG TPA: hypothetical protein EYG73_11420 [Arcobacter sp.]|nr:hypothetical protein [Arcobacter sp.]
MSSYKRLKKYIIILILSINIYANTQTIDETFQESLYVLMALDSELNKAYTGSAVLYKQVFEKTGKYEYLKKSIALYRVNGHYEDIRNLVKKNIDKYKDHSEYLNREYIIASIELKEYENALLAAKKLLKDNNTARNYAFVGDIYYRLKSYNHAITYYESSYASKQTISTLLPLVDILYSYLDKKKKAVSYIETYYREHGCSPKVCMKLLSYYQHDQNLDGMISILKKFYHTYKITYTKEQISRVITLLTSYLEKRDIKEAINFLEKNKINESRLLVLYGYVGYKSKALTLVRKLYRKTKNKSLLGQIAIFEFELAKDKKKVMKHVIANFELALNTKYNSTYANYYGYLLIDYDLDIKKGLSLVKKALKEYPNNLAYKDSVAWGYFKNNNCKMAYKYMKDVVKNVGLNDEDVKLHWLEIKNCKEK